jgi:hypothetical protein
MSVPPEIWWTGCAPPGFEVRLFGQGGEEFEPDARRLIALARR